MTLEAFAYSERMGLPVMLRLVTRLAHSRANVVRRREQDRPAVAEPKPPVSSNWTLVPAHARRRFSHLLSLQSGLVEDAEHSPYTSLQLAGPRGIVTTGIAHNYVREALSSTSDVSILKVGMYPLPAALIRKLVDHCHDVLVVEDGYPFIETRLAGLLGVPGKAIRGKLTGDLPASGELTPDIVARALGGAEPESSPIYEDMVARPPQLCRGCPHADSFKAIVEATSSYKDPILFSDIGCYTLGVMPPYRAVHATVDMGASIGMATGAARAGAHPVICTIGDSTFAHSGMTPLIGAVHNDAPITVFVLDNAATAMTGMQDSILVGEKLVRALTGLGVDPAHLHVIEPLPKDHKNNVELIRREIDHPGLSVIIPRRACIHVSRKLKAQQRLAESCAQGEGGN
jgi:indolepyruvate ferredoxin oxidoreductase alpha subunit